MLETSSNAEPVQKNHFPIVSRIPRLKNQSTNQNRSQHQTSATSKEITELREQTNVRFMKLETILGEINRKLEKVEFSEETL